MDEKPPVPPVTSTPSTNIPNTPVIKKVDTTPSHPGPTTSHIPTPPKFTPPTVKAATPKDEKTELQKKKEHILNELNVRLKMAGGLESNVGMNDPYWDLLRQFRSL